MSGAEAARVTARAKINLHLGVGALLQTGYHEIETVFQRIELGDDVTVRTAPAHRELIWRGADAGPREQNLAYRAAVLYAEQTGWPSGFEIEVEKRIPVGGGLGGGSADAAAVLRLLNLLSPRPASAEHLAKLALQLGSDVPFLLSDHPIALARGRGEVLTPLQPLPVRPVLLLVLPFGVSTRDAYRWMDDDRGTEPGTGNAGLSGEAAWESWDEIAMRASNDFEAVVGKRHPLIPSTLAELRRRYPLASLSGSGSTIYAILDDDPADDEPIQLLSGLRLLRTRTVVEAAPITVAE